MAGRAAPRVVTAEDETESVSWRPRDATLPFFCVFDRKRTLVRLQDSHLPRNALIKRKRPVTTFGVGVELGEVLEIIPEISPGLSTELSEHGADGDHHGWRATPALA